MLLSCLSKQRSRLANLDRARRPVPIHADMSSRPSWLTVDRNTACGYGTGRPGVKSRLTISASRTCNQREENGAERSSALMSCQKSSRLEAKNDHVEAIWHPCSGRRPGSDPVRTREDDFRSLASTASSRPQRPWLDVRSLRLAWPGWRGGRHGVARPVFTTAKDATS